MAEISKIKLPSGSIYEIKDEWARTKIGNIDSAVRGGVSYIGKTTTDLHDGSTNLSVIVGGIELSVRQGDMVSRAVDGKQDIELIFNGTTWNEIGSTGSLKSLAFKEEVSGTTSYTPEGSLTDLTFTGVSCYSTGSYTPAGSVSFDDTTDFATTVSTTEGDVTYTPAGTISAAFSGTSFQSSGNYTPAGSVSTPNITLASAGEISVVNNPTAETVVKSLGVYTPSADQPDGALAYWEVSGDTLVLKGIMQTTGASITTQELSVKTGDASYQSSQPSFTGTSATIDVSGTPTGTITGAEFKGTGVHLTTGAINIPTSPKFTGTGATLSVDGTPVGTVTGGFSGTTKSISIVAG